MRCSRVDDNPSDSGFASGREGVFGAAVRLAADCGSWFSRFVLAVGCSAVLTQNARVEQPITG